MRYIPHIGDTIHTEDNDGHCTDTVVVDVSHDTPIPYVVLQSGGETFTRTVHELQDHLPSMQDTQVIALTGEDRVGKSRIAEALVDEYARLDIEAEIVSFADPLRTIARNINIEVDLDPNGEPLGYEDALQRIELDVTNELRDTSVSGYEFDRQINDRMKQHLGYRDALGSIAGAIKQFQPTFFVDQALNKIHHLANAGINRIIIDDLRYSVEYEYLNAMLPNFTVHFLLSQELAVTEDTSDAAMRRDWAKGTGGMVFTTRGLSPANIKLDAQDILDYHEEDQGEDKPEVKVGTGAFFAPPGEPGPGEEGFNLDNWESVGIVEPDGYQLGGDSDDVSSIDLDDIRELIDETIEGMRADQATWLSTPAMETHSTWWLKPQDADKDQPSRDLTEAVEDLTLAVRELTEVTAQASEPATYHADITVSDTPTSVQEIMEQVDREVARFNRSTHHSEDSHGAARRKEAYEQIMDRIVRVTDMGGTATSMTYANAITNFLDEDNPVDAEALREIHDHITFLTQTGGVTDTPSVYQKVLQEVLLGE
jgi:hypothetical protein